MQKTVSKLNRRDFTIGFGVTGVASVFPGLAVSAPILIGEKTIRTVSDGNLQLPVSFLYPGIDENELSKILTENELDTKTLSPECNLTLLEDGDTKILFDAGAGPNFMGSAGKLFESLEAISIDPSEITDVIFTHGHPDHIWGIMDDFDEVSFSEANLHFPRAEWDYWRSEDTLEKMDEARKSFVIGARNRLAVMEDRVQLFNPGEEVLCGIEVVETAGHTPGHCSFAIHANSQSLMVIGDAITNHIVSFMKPDWPTGSDQNPEQGVDTRKKLLDRLATDKMQLVGYHLPNGGLGRVETKDQAYRFVQ